MTVTVDDADLAERLARGDCNDRRRGELCLSAHRLSMVGSLDELLCLPTLQGVRELWYQVETVRKVLRRLRGRALLCDEVGLGKTVEAGMIIKEYLLRGIIRSALVLVPPSLVAQWREEMLVKFGLDFTTNRRPITEARHRGLLGGGPAADCLPFGGEVEAQLLPGRGTAVRSDRGGRGAPPAESHHPRLEAA